MIPGAVRIVHGRSGIWPEVWQVAAGPNDGAAALRDRARAMSARLGSAASRSYAGQWALVASFDGPVGVDLEAVAPCAPGFADLICTPDEVGDPRVAADPHRHLTDVWSSKEALAKALGDALDYDPARLASPLYWSGGQSGRWRTARLDCPPGHVAWVCWAPPEQDA